jgi:3-(3-hydroxy-phenyl)propionate hydroxylase
VWKGQAEEALLDLYDRQRRTTNKEFIQAQTIRNKQTLEEKDMKVRETRMDELRRTAEDPKLAREFMLRTSLIASVRRAAEIT